MTSQLIEELIGYSATWCATMNGFYVQYEPAKSTFVSDAQLTAIDPLLPEAIRILCLHESFPGVGSGRIHTMLKLWSSDLHVVDTKGRRVAISDLYSFDIEDNEVSLNCDAMTYTELSTGPGKPLIKIPSGNTVFEVVVNISWLDQHHHGWRDRFHVAKALDNEAFDTVRYMLSSVKDDETPVLPSDLGL